MPHRGLTKAIQSEADLRKALDVICLDLGEALDSFTLFQDLMSAKDGPYTQAVSQSQTFWSLTYRGLLDSALSRLCRVYDQNDDALTLPTVLETIRRKPALLPAAGQPVDEAQLLLDLDAVRKDTNMVVKHLMMWRHQLIAHRDADKAVRGHTLGVDHPITYSDVRTLIDNGFEIVNRYSVAFFRTASLQRIVGADDYLTLLKTLQRDVEARDAKIQAEIDLVRRAAAARCPSRALNRTRAYLRQWILAFGSALRSTMRPFAVGTRWRRRS